MLYKNFSDEELHKELKVLNNAIAIYEERIAFLQSLKYDVAQELERRVQT